MSKPEIDIKNRDIENDDANHRILCVDDDKAFLYRIKQILKAYHVVTAMTVKQALQVMHNQQIDTVLLDIDLNGESGLDALAQIRKEYPSMDIVMVTGHRNPEFIVKAIKSGARDYVCKPINPPELIACVEKAKRAKEEGERVSALIGELDSVDITSRIVGHSKRFLNLLRTADKVKGHHDANALIMGESGTGKELLARYIHRLEENSKRPFIVVNCAAIPDNLIESELFGYEKGAFTGAIKNKLGKFAIADGGDIFLDEISTLKPQTQAKLLRVLQEKEFCPLGSNNHVKSNFRVIAATNDNLEELVSKGEFRLDLYHRLKIITLTIPPLRERKEDIEDLVLHFLRKFSVRGKAKRISKAAIEKLKEYNWPGNIRELENIVHSVVILSEGDLIDENNVSMPFSESTCDSSLSNLSPAARGSIMPLKTFLSKVEQEYIRESIDFTNGEKEKAAMHLGIGKTTLYAKLKKMKLD